MSDQPAVIPSSAPAATPACGHLFVSTALDMWTTNEPERFTRDFQINDTCYRRLDPEYYAWLRSRMILAKTAASAGQIGLDAFGELRHRFSAIHQWAVDRFGEQTLIAAVRGLDGRGYNPPVAEAEPQQHAIVPACTSRNVLVVSSESAALVDAIRDRGMSVGWTHKSLYQTGSHLRFALGRERGLLWYLKPGDRIGEVTTRSIEIIRPNDIRQRLYNPDVQQPWIVPVKK